MGLKVINAPTEEPVTVAEAKDWMNVDADDKDNQISKVLIPMARKSVEDFTRRSLVTTTWDLFLDEFPVSGEIRIPNAPLQSVTSISYVDADGNTQTWNASLYAVDTTSEPARIEPAFGETFPTTRKQMNAVTVRFLAGYGLAVDVPSGLKAGVLATVTHWYDNPGPVVVGASVAQLPFHVERLLWQFRVLSAV